MGSALFWLVIGTFAALVLGALEEIVRNTRPPERSKPDQLPRDWLEKNFVWDEERGQWLPKP